MGPPKDDAGNTPFVCEDCPLPLCKWCPVRHDADAHAADVDPDPNRTRPFEKERRQGRALWVVVFIMASIALIALCTAATFGVIDFVQGETVKTLTKAGVVSQDNHHKSTIVAEQAAAKASARQTQLLKELADAAAAIKFEGAYLAYQNGEIMQAQALGHELQTEISTNEANAKTELTAGQTQISNYLHYLSCLGTNPTNTAVCGAAPPLPPT